VKFLLDENFPLALYRRLREAGKEVEHVIALGQRGVGDDILRKRLAAEALVFLTQDEEFEDIQADLRSQVIISRLAQRLPIRERVEIWFAALEKFVERQPPERLFEVLPSGELVAWEIIELGRRLRGPI
jgi:predicted nuclease of predicted toxin-antitoxin system